MKAAVTSLEDSEAKRRLGIEAVSTAIKLFETLKKSGHLTVVVFFTQSYHANSVPSMERLILQIAAGDVLILYRTDTERLFELWRKI